MEVGATVGALVDVGALRDAVYEETFDEITVTTDNAGDLERGIRNHMASISGTWLEINLDNLAKVYSGVHAVTPADTTPVAVTDEECTLDLTDWVALEHKNGAGTEVASITVTTSLAGATVRNTDYVIGVNAAGFTCIARIAGGLFGDGDVALVDYTYTPLASRTYVGGGLTSFTPQVVRFTNYDVDDKEFRITIWKGTPSIGIKIEFQSDDAEDPAGVPIKITGKLDVSKTSGEQLFEIYDTQHSA